MHRKYSIFTLRNKVSNPKKMQVQLIVKLQIVDTQNHNCTAWINYKKQKIALDCAFFLYRYNVVYNSTSFWMLFITNKVLYLYCNDWLISKNVLWNIYLYAYKLQAKSTVMSNTHAFRSKAVIIHVGVTICVYLFNFLLQNLTLCRHDSSAIGIFE